MKRVLILLMALSLFAACKNNNEKSSKDNRDFAARWPQVERDGFMKNCEKKAKESGSSQLIAQSFCECMLDKMETLYPDIKDAAKLTIEKINEIGMKYREECLEEH
jgi:hypothetical protein